VGGGRETIGVGRNGERGVQVLGRRVVAGRRVGWWQEIGWAVGRDVHGRTPPRASVGPGISAPFSVTVPVGTPGAPCRHRAQAYRPPGRGRGRPCPLVYSPVENPAAPPRQRARGGHWFRGWPSPRNAVHRSRK
jgi:hypothetical protein